MPRLLDWMGRLTAAEESRASAIGKLGAYKTNFLKAQAGEKKVIADFVELQHEKSQADKAIVEKNEYLQFKEKEITSINKMLALKIDAHETTRRNLTRARTRIDILISALFKIKAFCESGNKLFARKTALDKIWKKTDSAIGEVSED